MNELLGFEWKDLSSTVVFFDYEIFSLPFKLFILAFRSQRVYK